MELPSLVLNLYLLLPAPPLQPLSPWRPVGENSAVLDILRPQPVSLTLRINTPRKEGGLGPLNIPLLADVTRSLSQSYGVLKTDEGIAYRYSWDLRPAPGVPVSRAKGTTVANGVCVFPSLALVVGASKLLTVHPHVFRGLFIIDAKGVLRQITVNDLPVGRSVDEALRLVQAFQYTDEHGEGE